MRASSASPVTLRVGEAMRVMCLVALSSKKRWARAAACTVSSAAVVVRHAAPKMQASRTSLRRSLIVQVIMFVRQRSDESLLARFTTMMNSCG